LLAYIAPRKWQRENSFGGVRHARQLNEAAQENASAFSTMAMQLQI